MKADFSARPTILVSSTSTFGFAGRLFTLPPDSFSSRIATRLSMGQAPHYPHMGLLSASMKAKPIHWLRSAWGTYKRTKQEKQ